MYHFESRDITNDIAHDITYYSIHYLMYMLCCLPYICEKKDHNGESHGVGPINLGSGGKETPWTAMLALEVC